MKTKLCLFVYLISVFFYSCKRNYNCNIEQIEETKTLTINSNPLTFKVLVSNKTQLQYATVNNKSIDVVTEINYILNKYAIKLDNNESPVGIALYYNDICLHNSSLFDNVPNAILLYYEYNKHFFTKYYSNVEYTYTEQKQFNCATSIFSSTDIIDLSNLMELKTKEIITMVDLSIINNIFYTSQFQIVLSNLLTERPKPSVKCSDTNPMCKDLKYDGTCVEQEAQMGPSKAYCMPFRGGDCLMVTINDDLESKQIFVENDIVSNIYTIRDSILSRSIKGKMYIDDYYYISNILINIKFDYEIVLAAYRIYKTNFLNNMVNFYNADYNNVILINSEIKDLLNEICNNIKGTLKDHRLITIIDRLLYDISTFQNKTIVNIRNEI